MERKSKLTRGGTQASLQGKQLLGQLQVSAAGLRVECGAESDCRG